MNETSRDSFVFYRSFYEALQNVPKKNRAEVYEAVFEYAFEAREPSLKGVTRALWELIRPQLDASQKRYENSMKGAEYGKKGAEYGKLGGRPKKEKTPLKGDIEKPPIGGISQNPLNVNVNENVNDNENVNVNVNASGSDGEQTTHTPTFETEQTNRPSNLDVLGEIVQHGYRLEGKSIKAFMDYNDERGWKMDWRLALKRWADREQTEQPKQNKAGKFANFPQRDDPEHKALVAKLINSQLANGGG